MNNIVHRTSSLNNTNNYFDCVLINRLRKQFRAISNMSLHGLPPLPKSLSGFADDPEADPEPPNPAPSAPEHNTPPGDLDGQLDYLKKEMVSLT